ncbi:fasciculation and elongation protein zeta [Chamberlinius hualienensis]
MREYNKMAELKIEAPLAKFETEEWVDFHDYQNSEDLENSNKECKNASETNDNAFVDNFGETFSGSLEDLVNTFDEKITKCFINYEDKVEKFAPVQVRSQEEIMNECQMWWTITGNFGNILPIDWSKSYARQLHMPALNLNAKRERENGETHDNPDDDDDDDEDVAKDLDLHSLIISSLQQEPMFTAEEVLEEIDEIMQESPSSDELVEEEEQDGVANKRPHTLELSGRAAVEAPLYEEKLKSLTLTQLNDLYVELEMVIKELSETLIQELALRDELEYEKELKNSFISLLLSVQNKRRQCNLEKKKKVKISGLNGLEPKYLTTVIPYHTGEDSRSVQTLQILIKILQAINEDSPTVPTLLTDYILKVICPT